MDEAYRITIEFYNMLLSVSEEVFAEIEETANTFTWKSERVGENIANIIEIARTSRMMREIV